MNVRGLVTQIPIRAIGKPRMTQRDKHRKRHKQYFAWSEIVVAHALSDGLVDVDPECVANVSWIAEFKPAKSWSKKRREAAIGTIHQQKPDRDNIDKAILDSLFKTDERIGSGSMVKVWSEFDRLTVVITYLDEKPDGMMPIIVVNDWPNVVFETINQRDFDGKAARATTGIAECFDVH